MSGDLTSTCFALVSATGPCNEPAAYELEVPRKYVALFCKAHAARFRELFHETGQVYMIRSI